MVLRQHHGFPFPPCHSEISRWNNVFPHTHPQKYRNLRPHSDGIPLHLNGTKEFDGNMPYTKLCFALPHFGFLGIIAQNQASVILSLTIAHCFYQLEYQYHSSYACPVLCKFVGITPHPSPRRN